jgi:hypothetical protein
MPCGQEFAVRDRPRLLAAATAVCDDALPALHPHFEGHASPATQRTRRSEFRFGFRIHRSLRGVRSTDDTLVTALEAVQKKTGFDR